MGTQGDQRFTRGVEILSQVGSPVQWIIWGLITSFSEVTPPHDWLWRKMRRVLESKWLQIVRTFPYHKLVCSLMYLTTWTRPDLAYSVKQLSRYLQDRTQRHIGAAKRELHFLIDIVIQALCTLKADWPAKTQFKVSIATAIRIGETTAIPAKVLPASSPSRSRWNFVSISKTWHSSLIISGDRTCCFMRGIYGITRHTILVITINS